MTSRRIDRREVTWTIRLDIATAERVDEIARQTGRRRSQLLLEAVRGISQPDYDPGTGTYEP